MNRYLLECTTVNDTVYSTEWRAESLIEALTEWLIALNLTNVVAVSAVDAEWEG